MEEAVLTHITLRLGLLWVALTLAGVAQTQPTEGERHKPVCTIAPGPPLNIRETPGGTILRTLPSGTSVRIIAGTASNTGTWTRIEDVSGRSLGWVYARYVECPTDRPGAVSTQKPSFDCTLATAAWAQIICTEQEGAAADWELNSASWARKGILDGPAKIAFEQDEGAWLNSLPVLCGLPPHLTSAVSQTQRSSVITV